MMRILPRILTVLAFFSLVSCRGPRVPQVPDGLIDLTDTVALGLPRLPDAELIRVTQPAGQRYVNNVVLTAFRGKYYCMWQQSPRDEDTPDSFVALSVSGDGRQWSEPVRLASPVDSAFASPGGWIQRGDSLCAVLNYIGDPERHLGGTAWYVATKDGASWTARQPLRMADGTPMDGILEQDPMLLRSGRTVGAAHFRPGYQVCPVYTDDPSGLRGWTKAPLPAGEGSPLEPSQYAAPHGRLVMFFRDQESSFRKLYSVSEDGGASWRRPRGPTSRTPAPSSAPGPFRTAALSGWATPPASSPGGSWRWLSPGTGIFSTKPMCSPRRPTCPASVSPAATRPWATATPRPPSSTAPSGSPSPSTRKTPRWSGSRSAGTFFLVFRIIRQFSGIIAESLLSLGRIVLAYEKTRV